MYKPWRPKGFFQFESIISSLVSSFRFIRIPMLWFLRALHNFHSFSVGTVFRRQNLTSRRQILTSKDVPRAVYLACVSGNTRGHTCGTLHEYALRIPAWLSGCEIWIGTIFECFKITHELRCNTIGVASKSSLLWSYVILWNHPVEQLYHLILYTKATTPHARHAWCVMRIRFGLAYSPLWKRSTRITWAYHDVIVLILPGTTPPPPKILACDPGTTTSNIGPIAKRCLGIYRFSCTIDF